MLLESHQVATVVLMLDSPEDDVVIRAGGAVFRFSEKCEAFTRFQWMSNAKLYNTRTVRTHYRNETCQTHTHTHARTRVQSHTHVWPNTHTYTCTHTCTDKQTDRAVLKQCWLLFAGDENKLVLLETNVLDKLLRLIQNDECKIRRVASMAIGSISQHCMFLLLV